jgi:hypothetical protein
MNFNIMLMFLNSIIPDHIVSLIQSDVSFVLPFSVDFVFSQCRGAADEL